MRRAASPCVDAGWDSAPALPALDMNLGLRQVGTVDIGADEADISAPYYLGVDADRIERPVNESAKITAGVIGAGGALISGCQVTFSAPSGTLTLTNNGLTDSDGKAAATLTSAGAGTITVTASVTAPFGKTTTKTIDITFFSGSAREDWPMFHHDIALSGVTSASVGANPATMAEKWSVALNGSATGEVHWSSPVVYDGVVYVGTSNGTTGWLYAIDALASGPSVVPLAKLNLGSPVIGTPCVHNGVIYVPTQGGGWLYANSTWNSVGRVLALKLNRTTNVFEPQWEYTCPNVGEEVLSSTTIYDGAVYFGGQSTGYEVGHAGVLRTVDLITRMDRSGSPAATVFKPDCITPGIDKDYVNPSASQPEPRVYVSDVSCYVTAAKCKTGERVWEWLNTGDGQPMYASPVIHSGYVYVGSDNNCIYKLQDPGNTNPGNIGEGHAWWFAPEVFNDVRSTPAAWNGKLYFGCIDDYVYRLDATTFTTTESERNLQSDVLSSPAISSATGMLFVGSVGVTNSVFYALNASDLSDDIRKYSFTIYGRQIKSSPAIISGRAFIVAGDGVNRYLYCFGD